MIIKQCSISNDPTGVKWYPLGTNAFTAHKALIAPKPYAPGKRRKLEPIDPALPEAKRRAEKNRRNRELMALKRAALRDNPINEFNCPISPKGVLGTSKSHRARAAI